MITLKPFQRSATDSAVELLIGGRPSGSAIPYVSAPDRRCVLIEAPTGSGKTVMAGNIVSQCGKDQRILWFWFAPFAGVVGQSAGVLGGEFSDIRIRNVYNDRDVEDIRPNDVYVTTWGAVASRNAASRIVRTPSESLASIDQVVETARDKGFLIGLVVDEAHHGFVRAPVAKQFVRDVLSPDVTILVTATPNDQDIDAFRAEAGLGPDSRVSVSRTDAVAAGLIKPGIRAVSFAPAPNTGAVRVDFGRTAIRYGVDAHNGIKRQLAESGFDITPLMLVQVESGPDAVEQAKRALIDFGIAENSIAIHTADEPDPNVLAIAQDETVQVLIFKMAVALGFDAPRAWTLVSLRSSRDVDFGIQIVGRVLRIDRRLQGRTIPESLRFGYVFVADPEVQRGLVSAAEQINQLRTDIQKVATQTTMVMVQIGPEGSTPSRVALPIVDPDGRDYKAEAQAIAAGRGATDPLTGGPWQTVLVPQGSNVDLFGLQPVAVENPVPSNGGATVQLESEPLVVTPVYRYPLRTDLEYPRTLTRERFPKDDSKLAECAAARIKFDAEALHILQREGVFVVRRELDIFRGAEADAETTTQVVGDLDLRAIVRDGQRSLFEDDYVGGRTLLPSLVRRFTEECTRSGMLNWLKDQETLEQGVYRILGNNPLLLRRALRECLSSYVESVPAEELPPELTSQEPLARSRLNIYGVIPPLNTWEVEFAKMLDLDPSGTILWWHRNPVRKPWSVSVCAPGARHDYYPDFVLGIRGRSTPHSILLVETKYAYQTRDSMAKVRSDHKDYGPVLMLTKDERGTWWTLQYDLSRDKVVEDQKLLLTMLVRF